MAWLSPGEIRTSLTPIDFWANSTTALTAFGASAGCQQGKKKMGVMMYGQVKVGRIRGEEFRLTLFERKVVDSLVDVNGVFTSHNIVQRRSGLGGLNCQSPLLTEGGSRKRINEFGSRFGSKRSVGLFWRGRKVIRKAAWRNRGDDSDGDDGNGRWE